MDQIRLWMLERFCPVVLVASTNAVEEIVVARNGLSLVDLLRAFQQIPRLDATVRVGETLVKVHELNLSFHAPNTLHMPTLEDCEEHLGTVLHAAAQRHVQPESNPELLQLLQSGKAPQMEVSELAPWLSEYQEELNRLLKWGDHEAIDYPVAAIFAIPADVDQPMDHIQMLQNQLQMPALMKQEVMYSVKDKDFPRYYLLVQDAAAAFVDDKKAAANLATVRRAFGENSASVIKLNSSTGDVSGRGASPGFFSRHLHAGLKHGGAGEPVARPPPPPQGLGACLSVSDLESVGGALHGMVKHMLLPKLEERIARLNASVTAARRGLRNRIARIWKGAGDEGASDRPYPWHSIEGQLRQLADLAFLLRAYDFAAATYRLAAQDYQANNNSRWYAGAEEMIGICVIMSPDDNDPQKYFLRAFEHYSRVLGKIGRLLATRSALLSARFQQAAGRYIAASNMLMRAHYEEENTRAGLLLEQSALCLLYASPPSRRKFAFQMVLAGLRYHAAGLKRLAVHSYRQVLSTYLGHRWRAIEEHLNDVLGKQSKEVGDEAAAANHFLALLQDCGAGRPPATQAHYLTQFLESIRRVAAKAGPSGEAYLLRSLRLPLINVTDAHVSFADSACHGNQAAEQVPPAVWARLEACVSGDTGGGGTNWLEAASGAVGLKQQQTKDHEEYNTVVAGEPISVRVTMRNPLGVKLRLSAVRLTCEFTPVGGQEGEAGAGSTAQAAVAAPTSSQPASIDPLHPLSANSGANGASQRHHHPLLEVQDLRVSLHPGESITESLTVTPTAPGWLRITGVTWVLNDTVEGFLPFDLKGKKRKRPKGDRPAQLKHYPPNRRLIFNVIPAMPRLTLLADTIPATLYTGELTRVSVGIRNTGTLPCRNLQLVISHPEVCCAGSTEGTTLPLLTAATGASDSVQPSRLPASCQGSGMSLYRPWPPDLELAPGAELHWPLWIHPTGTGTLRVHLVWCYEPVAPAPTAGSTAALKYRTLRLAHSIRVFPLLLVRPTVASSPADLSAHLLRLDMEGSREGEVVQVRQVSCLSGGTDLGWRMLATLPQLASNSSSTGAGAGSTRQEVQSGHTLVPGVSLQPAQGTAMMITLRPPALGAATQQQQQQPGEQAQQEPVFIPLLDPGLKGPISHWYGPGTGGRPGHLRHISSSLSTSLSTHQLQHLQQQGPLPAGPHTSREGGRGPTGAPAATALHADPPVDVVLAWQTPPSSAAPAGRVGLLRFPDITGTATPPSQPIRTSLRLVQGPSSGDPPSSGNNPIVRHDFRHAPLAVVHLSLAVRNCTSGMAQLHVQAGSGWSASSSNYAWALMQQQPQREAGESTGERSLATTSTMSQSADAPSILGLEPSSEYMWCGRTSTHITAMTPGSIIEVPLQLVVLKPGTYSIAGVQLSYSIESEGMAISETRTAGELMVRVESG